MAEVWISAASPLLTYTPGRSGPAGGSWSQATDGTSEAIDEAVFHWSAPASYSVQAGLDGALESASASSGSASLSTSFGSHSARLECVCEACGGSQSEPFKFIGVRLETQVVASGTGVNSTLDDGSSAITYSGFQSTSSSSSSVSAIQNGEFYGNTVSYTTSGGAAASFTFQGSALYVFGMTGPEFGTFTIEIDSKMISTYNASTTVETYNTLLFFTTYLDGASQHTCKITNQIDGMLLALDYFVSVQEAGTQTASASGPQATADFGNGSGNPQSGGDNAGAVASGIIGALVGVFLLWLWWRYHRWKKAGGKGSFFASLCGGRRQKAEAKKAEELKFHLWPMVLSLPKYAVPK
nr:uncharacterized protein CI109_000949 [Kwoniella shandongensis]KAA5530769.1 hypothetical protein CI109_000949 [Kwoniella shandongensis]